MSARISALESPRLQTPLNFEQQRKRARALLRGVRAHDADAIRRVTASHPAFAGRERASLEPLSLHDAQLVIARESGFATWARLKAQIRAERMKSPLTAVALLAAANRALETELPQPLYRDPFARDLAGELG